VDASSPFPLRPVKDLIVRRVFGRTRQVEGKAQHGGGVDPRVSHVVAIADPRHPQVIEAAPLFLDSLQISQHLAGVVTVGQAVNDGNGRMTSQLFHIGVSEGADNQGIQVARQDAGGISQRFLPGKLKVVGGHKQALTPQAAHGGLKGDPGAGRRLHENETENPAGKNLREIPGLPFLLQGTGAFDELKDLCNGEIA